MDSNRDPDPPRRCLRSRGASLFMALCLWAGATTAAPPIYRVVGLPVPADAVGSQAYAINSVGTVVGTFDKPAYSVPVAWSGPPYTMVVLTDPTPTRAFDSPRPVAINDAGLMVGASRLNNSLSGNSRATVWYPDGTTAELADLPGWPPRSFAYGVNSSGSIVGIGSRFGQNGSMQQRATLWPPGQPPLDLGSLSGNLGGSAAAINDVGAVVGQAFVGAGGEAFIWTATEGMRSLGSATVEASDINEWSQVVGTHAAGAFIWSLATGVQDLGSVAGWTGIRANSINNAGQVVGIYSAPVSSDPRSFYWTAADGMLDLYSLIDDADPQKALFATELRAKAVNDSGLIVVETVVNGNYPLAFLLVPSP